MNIKREELEKIIKERMKEYSIFSEEIPKSYKENMEGVFALGFRDAIIWLNEKEHEHKKKLLPIGVKME